MPVVSPLSSFGRANVYAGGFFTVVAADGDSAEVSLGAAVSLRLKGDQTRPGHADGQEMSIRQAATQA